MKFLEKDLENIIWENLSSEQSVGMLQDRGLDCAVYTPFRSRQLRIGNYGICDLVTLEHHNQFIHLSIYELKKDEIDIDSVIQVSKYLTGCRRYLSSRFPFRKVIITPIIIGRSIRDSDWVYLFNSARNNIDIYTYEYGLDGLQFESNNMDYYLIEEGF